MATYLGLLLTRDKEIIVMINNNSDFYWILSKCQTLS